MQGLLLRIRCTKHIYRARECSPIPVDMANAETWSTRVAEWRASGLTAPQFCAERGLSKSSLYMWSTRFPREGEAKPALVAMAKVVRVRDSMPLQAEDGGVRLELGDVRLYVGEGVQRLMLTTILEALDERAGRMAR